MSEATRDEPGARSLREWRMERLLTIRDLARVAGVGAVTVSRIEDGVRVPRSATIQRIAAALGVEPRMVVEFRAAAIHPDDREAVQRLVRMGYPPLLAQRVGRQRPSTSGSG